MEVISTLTIGGRVRQPWERYPRESPQAFEAFELYREMGPLRSIRKVGKEIGKSFTLMERWSRNYNWLWRVQQYEEYYDSIKAKLLHKRKMEAIDKQAALGRRLQDTANIALDCMGVDEMTAADVARLADVGVKIERLALGDSTSNVAHKAEVRVEFAGGPPPWAPAHVKEKVADNAPDEVAK